jgi:hypothetical protein
MRALGALLVITLLPVLPVGGFGGSGVVQAEETELRQVNIYVFGTETPIPDLVIRQQWPEYVFEPASVTSGTGKGYVRYTVDVFPNSCIDLKSEWYHFSNARGLCAYDGLDFVVQVHDTEYVLDLIEFYADINENTSSLEGGILFDRRKDYDGYELRIFDKSDGVNGNLCAFEGYIEFGWDFACDLPSNPSHLQLYILDGETSHPTNLKLRLDDVELPGQFAMDDKDPRVGWIEPVIGFNGLSNETGIALYQVIPPDSWFKSGIRYVPADGRDSYAVDLGKSQVELYHSYTIRLVDTEGNLFAKTAEIPIVDKISEQKEIIDYIDVYDDYMYKLDEPYEPEGARFTDTDPAAGARAGKIEWKNPDTGEYQLIAYDLYYADADDDNGIFLGEARLQLPYELPETVGYTLRDVPAEAEYLAIVPLLILWDEPYFSLHYSETIFVPLADRVAPRLDQLLVNGTPVSPKQENPAQYEFIVEWNAEKATVTASSHDSLVYVDGEGPDTTVTKVVYLYEPTTSVPIQVKTPEEDWTSEYTLTIIKEPAPDAPELTSLLVSGQAVQPVGTLYTVYVPFDMDSVPVTAAAGAQVEIELNGAVNTGSVTAVIPITGDEIEIPIRLYDPGTTLEAEYTLRIFRIVPDNLVLGVRSGWLKAGANGYEYGYVPKWMTAGMLKEQFALVSGTRIEILDQNGNSVADTQPVPAGSAIALIRGEKIQIIGLHTLSEHLKSTLGLSPGGPITFANIAAYAVRHRSDVTGDGKFDRQDVRLLLREMN